MTGRQRRVVGRVIATLHRSEYGRLYLIHQFNLNFVAAIAQRVLPMGTPRIATITTMLGLHLALAALFWYFCERPFLGRKAAAPSVMTVEGSAARTA
jgi:peptidoglycan/LPS O-acetylase OafA/YrhL